MTQIVEVLSGMLSDETVDADDVARVVRSTPRSVARWQSADVTPPRKSEERLLELKSVVDLARRLLRPESARLWLHSPNAELGDDEPLDLIAQGEYRQVIGALLAMAEGVTA